MKTGGWGRKETECKIVHIPPFCLALFPVPSHADTPPPPPQKESRPLLKQLQSFSLMSAAALSSLLFLLLMDHKQTAGSAVQSRVPWSGCGPGVRNWECERDGGEGPDCGRGPE